MHALACWHHRLQMPLHRPHMAGPPARTRSAQCAMCAIQTPAGDNALFIAKFTDCSVDAVDLVGTAPRPPPR